MSLRTVNNCLLALIILVNGYVLVAPVWPNLVWLLGGHQARQHHLQSIVDRPSQSGQAGGDAAAVLPAGHSLVIPAMGLDQPILEGPISRQYKILDRGIWRWPAGSTPDQGGNTVLIGHRFTYTNPRGVFYFLNKVRLGDTLAVFWGSREYHYKVSQITEVAPTDTAIEKPTEQARLTLFTCTPLWLPKDRLVVVATPEGQT